MAKIRNRNKYNKSKGGSHSFISLILSIPLLFILRSPNLQELRDSLFFEITLNLIISCIILYPTWFHKSKPKIVGGILLSLIALSFWAKMIVPSNKIWSIIIFTLFWCLVLYLCIDYFANKKVNPVVYGVSTFYFLLYISMLFNYKFVDSPNAIHFWKISLIIAVLITIVYIILQIKNVISFKKNKSIGDRILLCVIFLFFAFVLTFSTAYNLNHFLDKSEPTLQWAEITDRHISHSYRRGNWDYKFRLSLDGQVFTYKVSDTEYYHYEIGENYPINLYEGAFGEAYYISGNLK